MLFCLFTRGMNGCLPQTLFSLSFWTFPLQQNFPYQIDKFSEKLQIAIGTAFPPFLEKMLQISRCLKVFLPSACVSASRLWVMLCYPSSGHPVRHTRPKVFLHFPCHNLWTGKMSAKAQTITFSYKWSYLSGHPVRQTQPKRLLHQAVTNTKNIRKFARNLCLLQ